MEGEAGVHDNSENLRTKFKFEGSVADFDIERGVNIDVTDIVVGGEIGAFP